MTERTFTQEQLDEAVTNAKSEWVKKELNPVVEERDNLLKYKPEEKTDEEIALETKQQDLFKREVAFELKENGLDMFADVVKVSDSKELEEIIPVLQQIVNDIKVESGYIPENRAKDDVYSKYKKDRDTKGMISTKLASLFK